jgi:hypothetical protein
VESDARPAAEAIKEAQRLLRSDPTRHHRRNWCGRSSGPYRGSAGDPNATRRAVSLCGVVTKTRRLFHVDYFITYMT